MDKLYIVVRADMPAGDQAVQSVHAALQYAAEHHDWTAWQANSNFLALLSVADEKGLELMLTRAADRGIKSSFFREPDMGNTITAIALEPGRNAGRLCGGLPLTLSEVSSRAM